MPRTIDGVQYYTKAEIDQILTGGFVAALTNRNAMPLVVVPGDWNAQSGGDLDGWNYADLVHNRTTASLVVAVAFIGSDSYIHICDGSNDVQAVQNNTTLRLWLRDAPTYNLLCLLVYA